MHHLEGLHLATNLLTPKTIRVSVLIFLKFGWPSVVKCAGVVELQQSKNSNALFYMSNGMLLLYIIESQNVVGLLMRCSFTVPTRLGCSHAHQGHFFHGKCCYAFSSIPRRFMGNPSTMFNCNSSIHLKSQQ